jgi:protein-S-isoprenylcysteine O-methyltransferase Ste14
LFVAALLLGAAGPVAALLGLPPLPGLNHGWLRATGVVLAVLGVVAVLAAQTAMGASWRVGVDAAERTALVTGGVFALVRNPIFTAMLISSAGLALMVPNAVSVAGTAVLLIAIEVQVRAVEEPYLVRTHGSVYGRYVEQVGRFLPRLGVRVQAPGVRISDQ